MTIGYAKLFVPIFSVVPAKAGIQAAEFFLEFFNLHFLIVVRWRSVPWEMMMRVEEKKMSKGHRRPRGPYGSWTRIPELAGTASCR